MADWDGRYVQTESVRLHYREGGAGPPLVLLHGGGPAASGETHFVRNYQALAATHHVILVDLPNFGDSAIVEPDEPAFEFNARVIAGFLAAQGIERASFAGWSMGSSTCIALGAKFPAAVDKLVLVGGGSSILSLFTAAPSEGNRTLGAFMQDPTKANFERVYRMFLHDPAKLEQSYLDELWAFFEAHPEQYAASRRPSRAPAGDLAGMLKRIQAPTLIIRARDDRYSPLDVGMTMVWQIPNADLCVISKSGHWIQYEHAEKFNRIVRSFLAG